MSLMMNNAPSAPQNRNIDQILDESNIQSFLIKNKTLFIVLVALIIAAVVGFGIYRHFDDKSQTVFNSEIYTFETTFLKSYQTTKSDPKLLVEEMSKLNTKMNGYIGLVPLVIKTSDALVANNHLAEASIVLSMGEESSDSDYATYFILSRKAAVQEDLGQNAEAIETLLKLNTQSTKIFEGKNYVDLGRLYLKAGDKDKARTSFKYVVDNAKDEVEFVKLAQLYLAKM